MKTAIYIEDGVVQLVITPESDFEKNALKSFDKQGDVLNAQIFSGTFYDCRGGWTRQREHYHPLHGIGGSEDRSLIIRVDAKNQPAEQP